MNPREHWLIDSLQRYLDRRSMPQGLKEKPTAISDEVQSLGKTLFRFAPVKGYQDWWAEFSDRLAEDAKTRAWPTQGEMKDAAMAIRKGGVQALRADSDVKTDSIKIAADRIRNGQPVGEEWLWGRCCVEMCDKEGITSEQLRPYRSALFFADRDVADEEAALEREALRKERHQVALRRDWEGPRGAKILPHIGGDTVKAMRRNMGVPQHGCVR